MVMIGEPRYGPVAECATTGCSNSAPPSAHLVPTRAGRVARRFTAIGSGAACLHTYRNGPATQRLNRVWPCCTKRYDDSGPLLEHKHYAIRSDQL